MQIDFYDISASYNRLDKSGDPLLHLNTLISWEELRHLLAPISFDVTSKGGRPSLDPLLMVKVILLQSLYNISDDSCEYQINDRLSFKRFLGLSMSDKSPDAKTIWLYRERLKHSNLHDTIFEWFLTKVNGAGYTAKEGQIVDASFIPTNKPTSKHRKQLKDEIPLTSSQASQRDNDASFTKKNNVTHHGYKVHIQVDAKHKMIRKSKMTTASVHDSQVFEELLDSDNPCKYVFADSAYRSEKSEEILQKQGYVSQVHERSYRGKPLLDKQKASNKIKSKTRVRVEHVFGYMAMKMNGLAVHTIGLARAEVKIAFKNLGYNMQRFIFFESQKVRD